MMMMKMMISSGLSQHQELKLWRQACLKCRHMTIILNSVTFHKIIIMIFAAVWSKLQMMFLNLRFSFIYQSINYNDQKLTIFVSYFLHLISSSV
jgi:hypothetical protein